MTLTARTADGVTLQTGLRVWTNNLTKGEVVLDNPRYKPWIEHNDNTGTDEWWFYVKLDEGGMLIQSESRVATRFEGEPA